MPSLAQLNEAVLSFREEFPNVNVTVVVDATFGHRIAKSEVAEFDAAVAHNELVAPPAGAVGRGDAFVLSIANKSGARILSNDSFQEFHGTYPWLFDEGRLVGGKPVPYVGWVFVNRVPVKGAVSRKATGDRRPTSRRRGVRRASWPASRCQFPRHRPPDRPRTTKAKAATKAAATAERRRGRRQRAGAEGRIDTRRTGQRAVAVPRLHPAPPGRQQREWRRRVVLVARRLRDHRRRPRLRAAAADGHAAAAQRPRGDEAGRGGHPGGRQLRPGPPQRRPLPARRRRATPRQPPEAPAPAPTRKRTRQGRCVRAGAAAAKAAPTGKKAAAQARRSGDRPRRPRRRPRRQRPAEEGGSAEQEGGRGEEGAGEEGAGQEGRRQAAVTRGADRSAPTERPPSAPGPAGRESRPPTTP